MDIIYRRFNTQNQAFRARIGGAHSKVSEESGVFYDREWNSNLGLGIGYEWHHPINTRFTWYYGGELGVTYYWLDRDQAKPFVFEGVPQIQLNQSTIRTIELVLQGLGGINFQLNRKFFLIVEQSITLSSQNYDSIEFGDLIPINPPFDDNIGSSGFGEGVIKYNRVFFQTSLGIHFKF